MGLKYSLNELAQEINRSRPVTEKWAVRLGFKSTTKLINGKEIKAYELTEQELLSLKHELGQDTTIEAEYTAHYEPNLNQPEIHQNQANFLDKFIDYNEKHLSRIESYIERATFAEAQQKLISMSEANKDNEIHRLKAELKTALIRIETLESENLQLKQKTFFGLKFGK